MTRAVKAILSGSKIRFTLEQAEVRNPKKVRIDWLRFTVPVHSFVGDAVTSWADVDDMGAKFSDTLRQHGAYTAEDAQDAGLSVRVMFGVDRVVEASALRIARVAALQFNERIGGIFQTGPAEPSGMDFYAARVPLLLAGSVVGYVLAGGKSQAQADTVHFNVFGGACLYMDARHMSTVADWIDQLNGWITRSDLSLDVWRGLDMEQVAKAWEAGQFDVRGKRPKQAEAGSWRSGHSRTFYVGSRNTGKILRVYEKGDELFGEEANDPWVRAEVEFRSNHRVIETDVLRRPAEFFAGAYPWCEALLSDMVPGVECDQLATTNQTKDRTAEAAVTRVVRWVMQTAGPAVAALWNLGGDLVAQVVEENEHRTPRRLKGFAGVDVRATFEKVAAGIGPTLAPV